MRQPGGPLLLFALAACAPTKSVDTAVDTSADTATETADVCDVPDTALDALLDCFTESTIYAGEAVSVGTTGVPHGPGALAVGDLAGDGTQQVYIGTNSTLTRYVGPDWSTPATIWSQPDDGTATYPALADVDGDGQLDLLLGLPGSDSGDGQVLVFPGPITGRLDWDDGPTEVKGVDAEGLGYWPKVDDLDGDGVLDLFVLASQSAQIFSAPFGTAGATVTTGPFATFRSPGTTWVGGLDDRGGIADIGDLDGDGLPDVALNWASAQRWNPDRDCMERNGAVALYSGPILPGDHSGDDADLVVWPDQGFTQQNNPDEVGMYLFDLDADGQLDLLTPTIALDDVGRARPVIDVHLGPIVADPPVDLILSGTLTPVASVPDIGGGQAGLVAVPNIWLTDSPAIEGSEKALLAIAIPLPAADDAPFDVGDCTVTTPREWRADSGRSISEVSWVGDLDGDGHDDAVFASTDIDSADGVLSVVLDLAADVR